MTPTQLQLGKAPVKHDPKGRTMQASKYFNAAALPTPPATFGHDGLVKDWGMLGNDQYGDCVLAGIAHCIKLWNAECGQQVLFTDAAVLSDYAAITGFDPKTGAGDNGTNMLDALNYWMKTGMVDAHGVRHKLAAFVQLRLGDFTQLQQAIYLFGAVLIGIDFPASAMKQFNAGQPWRVVKGSRSQGGHCIPAFGLRTNYDIVTWGKDVEMQAAFYKKYCDEAYIPLSNEMLNGSGKSLEGFDIITLKADLAALKHG